LPSEVKSLATQTAKATEEIGQQIAAIQGSTDKSVESVRTITSIMQEVDGYTSAIAPPWRSRVRQQRRSRAMCRWPRWHRGADAQRHRRHRRIRETSSAADDVLRASGHLSGHANALKQEVDRFLVEVAAPNPPNPKLA